MIFSQEVENEMNGILRYRATIMTPIQAARNASRLSVVRLACLSIALLGLASRGAAQTTVATPVSNANPSGGGAVEPPASSAPEQLQHVALMHLMDAIEPYHPRSELKGNAVLAGSTTMQSLARAWAERFRKFHPDVVFTKGKEGTSAGIQEIAENPNVIAGASRPLTPTELESLKGSHCKDPLAVIVALDPLALYVHKSNPIPGITPEQLEAILRASTPSQPNASKWGDLGLTGEWASQPIRLHGRNDLSGTTGFIKHWIIRDAELARSAQVYETNEQVAKGIGIDPLAVGLIGFGDSTDAIRGVPLIIHGTAVEPTEANFLSGNYTLVRPLLLIIDKAAMKTDGGVREGILRYVLSRDGQMEAVRAGFFPLDPAFIRKQLDTISGPQLR